MSIEARTVRPRATGSVMAKWQERYGEQRAEVQVDPGRLREGTEISVDMQRRWGPQLGDVKRQDFWLSREGAVALRDALAAALEWEADE